MSTQPSSPPEVFVSYSHVDEDYKDELVKQLNILAEQRVISCWHDGLLVAGQQWDAEIVKRLKSSRVILLLISSDFLNSVYINQVELEHASKRYQDGEVVIIPILVRSVNGWRTKPFGKIKLGDLQALPSSARFIKQWKNRDDAYTNVAAGIQKAVEKLGTVKDKPVGELLPPPPPPSVPTSHLTDYVRRHDEKGRDILERLKESLASGKKGLITLWGKGGTGKTRIAAEAAASLTGQFGQRIVWASAEKRTDFSFSTLLDEIAKQLGEPGLLKLAQEPKEEAVRGLLAAATTLIILDNFETVASADERAGCVDFLAERAHCAALITSRQKVGAPARNIPIKGMSNKEAQKFLDQLIEQTQESDLFTKQVRNRIIKTAESNPYIMLWMVAQIDEAQTPKKVLDELEQGRGAVAERVFDRSFTLQQVGEDGRATLLALSLFVPDGSRKALAEVAGFGNELGRLDEAAKSLRTLWLIGTTEENERLAVEGLTRSLARARLSKDERADEFRKRFVAYFLNYAGAHAQPTAEDFDALEAEKDNVLSAMDAAFDLEDWESVVRTSFALNEFLDLRGYWNEAIRSGTQALAAGHHSQNESSIAGLAHNLAIVHHNRGDLGSARRLYDESLEIKKRLGNQRGIANTLHELGRLAHFQGELAEARQLYDESLAIKRKVGDQSGIASTLHELGRLAQDQGELAEARQLYDESLAIKRKVGDQGSIASTLGQLATLAQDQGELAEARQLYNESLEISRRLGNQSGIAKPLHQLAIMAHIQGEIEEARRLYNESLEINKRLGNQGDIAIALHQLGRLAEDEKNRTEAARLFREALSIFERLKSPKGEFARRSLERVESKTLDIN